MARAPIIAFDLDGRGMTAQDWVVAITHELVEAKRFHDAQAFLDAVADDETHRIAVDGRPLYLRAR